MLVARGCQEAVWIGILQDALLADHLTIRIHHTDRSLGRAGPSGPRAHHVSCSSRSREKTGSSRRSITFELHQTACFCEEELPECEMILRCATTRWQLRDPSTNTLLSICPFASASDPPSDRQGRSRKPERPSLGPRQSDPFSDPSPRPHRGLPVRKMNLLRRSSSHRCSMSSNRIPQLWRLSRKLVTSCRRKVCSLILVIIGYVKLTSLLLQASI